jgi:GH25 family lysozyme M1 (1,4-beta-N-acetylmuramidase)
MRRALTTAAAAITVLLLGAATGAGPVSASPVSAKTDSASAAAAAAAADTGRAHTGTTHRGHINRFNVSATHSPELERLMFGHAVAARSAAHARPVALPSAASTVEGIDVASGQHPSGAAINWSQVAAAQYEFVFIKVTEGSYYTNPYYAADAAGAKAAGMLTAPYAFAIPNYSGGALQADYALNHANYLADGRTLPLILDIEYDPYDGEDGTNVCYGLTPTQMVAWIKAFVTEASRRTGQLPVIYTTQDWWNLCAAGSTAFAADPLWVASYESTPVVPAAWGAWAYWQYTDAATVSGISVATDASWLSSTALELTATGTQTDQVSSNIDRQLNALDGGGAITFSATELPQGVQVNASTGALSGQLPATAATFPGSVTASAAGDVSVTLPLRWDVHAKVALGPLSSQTGSVGSPVRYQARASDGLSGCTLHFSAAGLPSGLVVSSCGMISGWLSVGGHYTVHVQVSDSSGTALATGSFAWTVGRAGASGPAGHIWLSRDGKCLAALSATSIAIETCSSATNQHWTVAADGSLRVNGSCLAAKATTSSSPTALELTSCTDGQRWQLGSRAVLTNVGDGRCLADTGSNNGSLATAAVCVATPNNTGNASTPSPSQQWVMPGALPSGIAGYCASNVRSSGQQTGAVTLRTCDGTTPEEWTVLPDGALSVGGKCLGLTAGATAPGTRARLGTCESYASQVWQLAGGPMGVQVVSPLAGLCLADPGDSATAGTQLVIDPCVAGDPGISWRAG